MTEEGVWRHREWTLRPLKERKKAIQNLMSVTFLLGEKSLLAAEKSLNKESKISDQLKNELRAEK
jgi:hypothetical protein